MEFTLDDYKNKFIEFRDDAYSHQNNKIGDFIDRLLNSNAPISVYEVLYPYYDDLKEDDIDIFEYLLSVNASADWYSSVTYLSDQRSGADDYELIIRRMFENGISASDIVDCEKRTGTKDEFIELAENLILKFGEHSDDTKLDDIENHKRIENEFIKHLKSENDKIETRFESLTSEHNELKSKYDEIVSSYNHSNSELNNLKLEYDSLTKTSKRTVYERNSFEKKYLNQKELVAQLSDINNDLQENVKKLESDKEAISSNNVNEMSRIIEEKTRLSDEVNKLNEEIKKLSDKNIQLVKESVNSDDLEAIKDERDRFKAQIVELKAEIENLNNRIKSEQSSLKVSSIDTGITVSEPPINLRYKPSNENMAKQSEVLEQQEFESYDEYVNFGSGFDAPEDIPEQNFLGNNSEADVIEYDTSDIIYTEKNQSMSVKVKEAAKSFVKAFTRLFNHKFEKKPLEEQKAIITAEILDKDYSKDVLRSVNAAIKNNNVQAPVLYSLVQNAAPETEIIEYCQQ